MTAPTTYFYHDGRHTLIYMYEPPITRQQFEQAVDELLGGDPLVSSALLRRIDILNHYQTHPGPRRDHRRRTVLLPR